MRIKPKEVANYESEPQSEQVEIEDKDEDEFAVEKILDNGMKMKCKWNEIEGKVFLEMERIW